MINNECLYNYDRNASRGKTTLNINMKKTYHQGHHGKNIPPVKTMLILHSPTMVEEKTQTST